MRWFYNLFRFVCNIWFIIVYRIKFEGLENIPKGRGGYMLISNHRSMMDPIALVRHVHPWVHYMGKQELFENFISGLLFKGVGVVPVNRGAGDTSAIDSCVEMITKGDILGIFPEGTRSKDGTPLRPKSGAALIARMAKADVLPCCVDFEGELKFGTHVTIRYGELIPFEELGFTSDSPRELKQATKRMFGAVLDLLGAKDNGESHDEH